MKRLFSVSSVFIATVIGVSCAKNRNASIGLSPVAAKTDSSKANVSSTTSVINFKSEDLKNIKWAPANGKLLMKDLDAAAFDFPSGFSFPAKKIENFVIKFSNGSIYTKDESKDSSKPVVCTIHFVNADTGPARPEAAAINNISQNPNYLMTYKGITMIAVRKTTSPERVHFSTETTGFSAKINATVDDFNSGCFKGKVRVLVPQGSKQSVQAQQMNSDKKKS